VLLNGSEVRSPESGNGHDGSSSRQAGWQAVVCAGSRIPLFASVVLDLRHCVVLLVEPCAPGAFVFESQRRAILRRAGSLAWSVCISALFPVRLVFQECPGFGQSRSRRFRGTPFNQRRVKIFSRLTVAEHTSGPCRAERAIETFWV